MNSTVAIASRGSSSAQRPSSTQHHQFSSIGDLTHNQSFLNSTNRFLQASRTLNMASSLQTFTVFLLLMCWQNVCLAKAQTYFADWSALAEDRQPTCVAIPSNMTLCTNIGYNKMRLPNLLEHDTIQEASNQAQHWNALIQTGCSEHTKLFLCSLFAPVCLDR